MISIKRFSTHIFVPYPCHNPAHDIIVPIKLTIHYAVGPRRPPPPQLEFRRSRDLAHGSIPLAQTPWGLTGRAWLQAGAQQAVIAVVPSFNSLGIDSRNVEMPEVNDIDIVISDLCNNNNNNNDNYNDDDNDNNNNDNVTYFSNTCYIFLLNIHI